MYEMITFILNDLTFFINRESIEKELGEVKSISDNTANIIHKPGSLVGIEVGHCEAMTEIAYAKQTRRDFQKTFGIKPRTCSFKKIGYKNILLHWHARDRNPGQPRHHPGHE